MAVGVPVIIHPKYEQLFGEAAIYALPENVQQEIDKLMNDDALYLAQVEKAHEYVEKKFGYAKHSNRLEAFLRD